MKNLVLKNKNLDLLFLSAFISAVFSESQSIALSLYVLNKTQSVTAFSTLLAITLFSSIWLRPFTGVLADKWNRKTELIVLNFLSFLVLIVTSLFADNNLSLVVIYGLVIILNIITAFYSTGSASLVRVLAGKEQLSEAYSINSFISSCQALLSPILGALLFSSFGIITIFTVNGLSFLVALIGILFVNIPDLRTEPAKGSFTKNFISGFSYFLHQKVIKRIAFTLMFFNFFAIPLISVGEGYVLKLTLKVSNQQFAFSQTIGVVGTLLGPVIFHLMKNKIKLEKLFFLSILELSGLILILGISASKVLSSNFYSYILYLATFFVMCIVETLLNIAISTQIQSNIDLSYSGRLGGIMAIMFMGLTPFGQLLYGALFEYLPVAYPFMLTTVIYVIIALYYKRGMEESN